MMNIIQKFENLALKLEEEFSHEVIEVKMNWASDTRFLAIGIDIPLWPSFYVNGRMIPLRGFDAVLIELYNEIKHDLNIIDDTIRANYE